MTRFGVIFDVDGVLVDSYEAHFESWRLLADRIGEQITRADFIATFGRRSQDIIALRWPHRAVKEEEVRALDEAKEAIFRELVREQFPAMPGATALLESLAAARFQLAVGSSGHPENVQLVLQHVDPNGRVGVRVTGDDVTHGKPDPEVFLIAASRLRLEPAYCTVVEDAPAGIDAAHAAGMRCIGLASRGRTREELAAADLCVNDLRELRPDDFAPTPGRIANREDDFLVG